MFPKCSLALKIGFVDMWPAGSTLRLSGVSNKSQNNFVAVQSLSLKKNKNTCKEHNVIHDFHACRDRPRVFVSFWGVRKSVDFSLTIIENFGFQDENKYEYEIIARVLK